MLRKLAIVTCLVTLNSSMVAIMSVQDFMKFVGNNCVTNATRQVVKAPAQLIGDHPLGFFAAVGAGIFAYRFSEKVRNGVDGTVRAVGNALAPRERSKREEDQAK